MNEGSSVRLKVVDGYWDVDVFLDRSTRGYHDKVVVLIREECPAATKQLNESAIRIGISAADARELARRLIEVAARDEAAAGAEGEHAAEDASAPPGKPRRNPVGAPFTSKQGQYLAFIHRYISKYGCAPAESDIQRHFLVSAPTVNQMMQRLERLGLIARIPGQARSTRLLVPPELLPRS